MAELISNPIRIPCGGFDIDNDTLYFQNDVLKSKREDPELPAVSAIDNGKVLTVAEGSWTAANPVTELPSVTSDDNGDVLTVVEGAWAKAEPSGGGGALMVELSVSEEQPDLIFTLGKTWQEIKDALKTKPVIIFNEDENVNNIITFNVCRAGYDAGSGAPYLVYFIDALGLFGEPMSTVYLWADTANGYPSNALEE